MEFSVSREATRRTGSQPFELALTPMEMEIAGLTIRGLSNKGIARELCVAEATVELHLYNIFKKLRINNRTQLAALAHMSRRDRADSSPRPASPTR